ncbi:MAG: hypothetical protein DRJ40_05945 [Thermoprotei archaeon]|nr:MAG: hypothetical protein DRJ40_05945 [Thermoprotei archaeon]
MKRPTPADACEVSTMGKMEKVPTGIPGFDEAIGGGFTPGTVVLVAGNPGSGKTTFAAKFVYEGAKRFGEPGVYISLHEPREEFYMYMKDLGMDFRELEERRVFKYIELLPPLGTESIDVLADKLVKAVVSLNAKRVVIDSITPFIRELGEAKARTLIRNVLKTISKGLGAVTLLIAELPYGAQVIGLGIEEFMVDAVVVLYQRRGKAWTIPVRYLEIRKMRGRPVEQVVYQFVIGPPEGFTVLNPVPLEVRANVDYRELLKTYISELDEVLGGGLYRGSVTLLQGHVGTGKTLLSLIIAAENAMRGKKVLYISFEEPTEQLQQTLETLSYPVDKLRPYLQILFVDPKSITPSAIVSKFVRRDTLPDLVIFDGISSIRRVIGRELYVHTIRDLCKILKAYGITTIFTTDEKPGKDPAVSAIADNIIWLRFRKVKRGLVRTLMVLKNKLRWSDPIEYLLYFSDRKLHLRKLEV